MRKWLWNTLAAIALLSLAASCAKDDPFVKKWHGNKGNHTPGREQTEETRSVMILFSEGYNSLSYDLQKNIQQLHEGYVPYDRREQDVILVFSHHTEKGSYTTPVTPVLFKIAKNKDGAIIQDTIKAYPEIKNTCSAECVNTVLKDILDLFPAKKYGLVYSSHASGWLPEGYYADPSKYEGGGMVFWSKKAPSAEDGGFSYVQSPAEDSFPRVKSVGQCVNGAVGHEMTIQEFTQALPMKFEYILFDACLMGCVETAYELKDKCDYYVGSPTEVLSQGFFYETLAQHLLQEGGEQGVKAVCEDYFDFYAKQSGECRSATISMIDCRKIEAVAQAAKDIFETHRSELGAIKASRIQGYFRFDRHYFYDLGAIIDACSPSPEQKQAFSKAMGESIVYLAATERFIGITINSYSGLSSYLPVAGSEYLNNFYRDLQWNKATSLVK
ncbi:MAG: clostripain-related cysteine peptidase [Bacteroidales bacterium]|nr:clostripain-related cysteine peptidase [Bacteroidales bacterium]